MGILNRFFSKKEEPQYDSTDIKIQDLDVGFVFDYDLSSWEVLARYEYDWGDEYFTSEFKINNGEETLFLDVEEDDELTLSIGRKIKLKDLGEEVLSALMDKQKPPSRITYNQEEFRLIEEAPGYFNDTGKGDHWEEFIAWDYENNNSTKVLTIDQWGEREFEASIAKYVEPFEISNILPSSSNR